MSADLPALYKNVLVPLILCIFYCTVLNVAHVMQLLVTYLLKEPSKRLRFVASTVVMGLFILCCFYTILYQFVNHNIVDKD